MTMTAAYGQFAQLDTVFTARAPRGPQGKVHDAPVTLTVTVTKVAFRDEATGFFIANTAEGVSVKGSAMFITEGVKLVVSGKWKNGTGSWPMYIYADKVALAEQGDAIKVLLGSGFLKGVKMKMAESIANHYGDATFLHLNAALTDPKTLMAVKGIGPVNCTWIAESWRAQRHWANAALVAIRVGLTMRQSKQAYEEFGGRLVEVINDNPYLLTTLDGITWARADDIAAMAWNGKQKVDHDDPKRYVAALREVLRQAYSEGHMALPYAEALARAEALATPTLDGFAAKVEARLANPDEGLTRHGAWLYLSRHHRTEREAADVLQGMIGRPPAPLAPWETIAPQLDRYVPFKLSEDQVTAVREATCNAILVITGGPGTGKSTIAKAICNIFAEQGQSLTLCAPTGKAARRLAEATGRPASTIHRTLGIGMGGDARRFSFTTDLVLIDEASMIDAALMRQVLQACAPQTRLILVGDVDQLPPVGAGEPFYQIIQSGAPVVRLTHIHRQGRESGIVWTAHGFNAGLVVDVAPFDDIDIVNVAGNQALRRTTMQQVAAMLAAHDLSIADVTVLTPLNKHDWGQEAMNLELQAEYNPGNPPLKACPFKEGDKVIHVKNVYDMRGQQVMNGMAGIVTWIASAGEEQILMARRAERGDDELPVILRVRFDGEDADTTYTRHELEYLKLAYALTIHKTQGSEYPYVVMMVPQTRDSFMMRQLAYTGLTRAKQRCVIISAQSALQAYVQNEERVRRETFLAEMVQAGAHVPEASAP